MVPVVTRAPNITNISCWKIAPKPLVYIDPRILLNYCTLISGETIQDWIERYFSNSGIFPKFRSLFHQSVPHCLRFYLCVSASPITSKIVRFFHSFVDSCIGTICHHKDFTGRVLLWENFISPRNNLFHTQKIFFSGKVHIPKWAPFAPNGTANQIAGNPGTTVVSIGHLTPWPQNPGYRTQVWDKYILCADKVHRVKVGLHSTYASPSIQYGLLICSWFPRPSYRFPAGNQLYQRRPLDTPSRRPKL